ncbi:MAG: TRAP transporter small permease [Pseudolabrys sp.]|nr:TRAP transporter small permease [Pseudolabrys sp.]
MAHGLDEFETASEAVSVKEDTAGFERFIAPLNYIVVLVSSIALVVASLVLTYSVASRYFFHFSTDWQDEFSVFLIVGAVFMSAAAVQSRRGHVAIEAFSSILSARTNRVRLFIVDVATFAFCAYFAWKSWILLEEAFVDGYRTSSTWQPPLWIPYSLMTAGMILLTIQVLLQIATQIQRWNGGLPEQSSRKQRK